jgi:hypothetical protein
LGLDIRHESALVFSNQTEKHKESSVIPRFDVELQVSVGCGGCSEQLVGSRTNKETLPLFHAPGCLVRVGLGDDNLFVRSLELKQTVNFLEGHVTRGETFVVVETEDPEDYLLQNRQK